MSDRLIEPRFLLPPGGVREAAGRGLQACSLRARSPVCEPVRRLASPDWAFIYSERLPALIRELCGRGPASQLYESGDDTMTTMVTAPQVDKEANPWESQRARFDLAAQKLNLDEGLWRVLRYPNREI